MSQRVVRMTHPDLDQEITVPESAVPIHMASGWAPVPDEAGLAPERAGGPVVIVAPEPDDVADKAPETARRGSTTKKGD